MLHEHLDQKGYCEKLREIAAAMQPYHFLQKEVGVLQGMADAAVSAFNVAVFGYMKTGKSSLINAYIGEPRAIIGVNETTATINKITYGDGEQLKQFIVHWHGQLQESLSIDRLREWTGTDDDTLARIRNVSFLEMFSNIPQLKDVNIIDTPGMGANVEAHEKAAQQFISGRQTDAIVYVLDVGRQSAVDALKTFKKTCLEGTKPYNSMAVLHKWDSIYWANDGNFDEIKDLAQELKDALQLLVADVLPVSAPLALIAKIAPDDFWQATIGVLSEFPDETQLLRKLKYDETYWATTETRKMLWQEAVNLCQLPWPCFKVMLRELYRAGVKEPAAARGIIMKLSGIEMFEHRLCSDFFEQRAVIRMRQLRAHAQSALAAMNRHIHAELDGRKRESEMTLRARNEVRSKDVKAWLDDTLAVMEKDIELLDRNWHEFDKEVKKLAEVITYSDNLLAIRRWLESEEELPFTQKQITDLRFIVKMVLYPHTDNVQAGPDQRALEELRTSLVGIRKFHPNRKYKQFSITLEDALRNYESNFVVR